ncbi:MAG: hypothetical protein M1371_02350 [Actinobacteria bacterium]|nr:hypothetical protein [Actinomycetota bacterium]
MRIFSFIQWYHFGFLFISIALLGFGFSGLFIEIIFRLGNNRNRFKINSWAISLSSSASMLAGYLVLNYVQFDSFAFFWSMKQVFILLLYYVVLAVPFFLVGLCVGYAMFKKPAWISRIYFYNMSGSAIGALLPLLLISQIGAERTIFLTAALAAIASAMYRASDLIDSTRRRLNLNNILRFGASGMLLVFFALLMAFTPQEVMARPNQYKSLAQVLKYPDSSVMDFFWGDVSRVDVISSSSIRSAPGLSFRYSKKLPLQDAVFFDGDNLSPLIKTTVKSQLRYFESLPSSLPYELLQPDRVLIVFPRGGSEMIKPGYYGSREVVVLEEDPVFIKKVAAGIASMLKELYPTTQYSLMSTSPRSFISETEMRFDLIVLPLLEGFRVVTSGSYSFAENYLLTKESIQALYDALLPDGILTVERWHQIPPTDALKAFALLNTPYGVTPDNVIAIRSWSTELLMLKKGDFTDKDVEIISDFCERNSFDISFMMGLTEEQSNRFNVLKRSWDFLAFKGFIEQKDRTTVYANSYFDIQPPTDDRPYYYNYFKFRQLSDILKNLGKAMQPFGGAGFLIIIALIAISVLLSILLMLLPTSILRRFWRPGNGSDKTRYRWCYYLYFAAIGLGFIFIEIPMIQKNVLLLGSPSFSFPVSIFSLLAFTAIGSYFSAKVRRRMSLEISSLAVLVSIFFYGNIWSIAIYRILGLHLVIRGIIGVIMLFPLGFLLGLFFPLGIKRATEYDPNAVPMAWAANGFASVVGAILAAAISMSMGFRFAMYIGALFYLLAGMFIYMYSRLNARLLAAQS